MGDKVLHHNPDLLCQRQAAHRPRVYDDRGRHARAWSRSTVTTCVFLTGTDENSQKTVDAAKKSGEEIHAYTDRMAAMWESTWEKLGISNTDFIRTTEERHIETVKDIWGRIDAAGDIYIGTYEGLYCKGREEFIKEDELVDGLCPEHKTNRR